MNNLLPMKEGAKRFGILCLDCGWLGVSLSRHDYKTCPCPNQAMIDGGTDYTRYGAVKMERVQLLKISVPKKKKEPTEAPKEPK